MYVYPGRMFSANAWFAAMKAGHTFVTNGPMIELKVDNAIPGDELKLGADAGFRIRARAWAPKSIGSPKTLEIVAQGEVIHPTESNNPDIDELRIDVVLKLDASQWTAARVSAHNGTLAHTSPVYVVLEGRSFRNQKAAAQLVEKRLKVFDFIASRLHDQRFILSDGYSNGEIEALMAEIAEAHNRLDRYSHPAKQGATLDMRRVVSATTTQGRHVAFSILLRAKPSKPFANCARIVCAFGSDGPLAQLVEQLTLNQ